MNLIKTLVLSLVSFAVTAIGILKMLRSFDTMARRESFDA